MFNPDDHVTLISVDCKPNYSHKKVSVVPISSDKLINHRINSVKSMLFDLTDYDIICHYDCDFIFKSKINIPYSITKILMVKGHSRGPQINQPQYFEVFKILESAYLNNIGFISTIPNDFAKCVMYNAGFFIASRNQHGNIFEDWKKLMSIETAAHKKFSNVIDQYIINYLVYALDMLEPASIAYNMHFTVQSEDAIAIHYAGDPQAHLHNNNNVV